MAAATSLEPNDTAALVSTLGSKAVTAGIKLETRSGDTQLTTWAKVLAGETGSRGLIGLGTEVEEGGVADKAAVATE